jgi:hypothetical protein
VLFAALLHHEIEAHPFSFQPFTHYFAETPGCLSAGFLEGLPAEEGHQDGSCKFRDVQTCRRFDVQTIPNSFISRQIGPLARHSSVATRHFLSPNRCLHLASVCI